jgi:hypothetical protein
MNTSVSGARSTASYLIVLKDYLVALDLAESISEFDAGAQIVARHSAVCAIAALEAIERVAVAFVDAGLDQFVALGLQRMISDRGGRVVLMGDEAESAGEARGYCVLHRPFSQGLVLSHLANLQETAGTRRDRRALKFPAQGDASIGCCPHSAASPEQE